MPPSIVFISPAIKHWQLVNRIPFTYSIYSNIILIKTETMDARTKTPDYIQTLCELYINLIHIVGSQNRNDGCMYEEINLRIIYEPHAFLRSLTKTHADKNT